MNEIDEDKLSQHRQKTYHLYPQGFLRSIDDAIDFVNERSFIYFWPIRGIDLPSLWVAAAGDRPVADAHDDPGHVTWGWKDSLLGSKAWYYGKILRKKATIISMEVIRYFYALSENYGSPEDDYLIAYQQGRLTQDAKAIYESVFDKGPIDTIALRKAARMSSPDNESRFNKALADLQADFKIVPVAVTQAGAWRYSFAYDIIPRHYPEIPEQARFIGELDARRTLIEIYIKSVGAVQLSGIIKLFGWSADDVRKALDSLRENNIILLDVHRPNKPGSWIALHDVCS